MAPRKDNVALICDIGELAGLFEKSKSLESFLQTAVSIVAYHMKAAVCSVYLYDETTQQAVLTANQGLDPSSIGTVKLKLGEGLVGAALKELRPIREGMAFRSPLFKFVPGINEERYQAFLAVPIMRGLTRVGVLVVQDPVQDYFDDNDTKALQAIAAQFATVIENAKLLMSLRQLETPAPQAADNDLRFVRGVAASRGYASGQAALLGALDEPLRLEGPCTLADFNRALEKTEGQLEALQTRMEERLADVASMIFSAHLLIVKDSQFSGQMIALIQGGMTPPLAIAKVVGEYTRLFASSSNPRLREKVQDVQDLGRRLTQNLRPNTESEADYRGQIIIAGELLPSDILKIAAQRAEGLLLVGGGATAHVAILAKSLELPAVVVENRRFLKLEPGCPLLIDGDQGTVYVRPTAEIVEKYRELAAVQAQADKFAAELPAEATTTDGQVVQVFANINLISEIAVARKMMAGGIGLYRSEFPFIVRNDFPIEEEQFRIYRTILEGMENRPVVFRTLDIGGDKMLSYFPSVNEANPFLGLRAIRFSLRNKNIFSQQLRALLRAGATADLRIMFPLVSSVDDFLQAKDIVRECLEALAAEKIPHNPKPKLGVMVELPSAVEVSYELAAEADFLSIGSNDLVQYILAVDRTNEHISDLYLTHHPAVLRSLKRVADAALAHGKPLSLCGEMAATERMLPFLLGIGISTLSVEVRQIPVVKKRVQDLCMAECRAKADQLLKMGRIKEVEAALGVGS